MLSATVALVLLLSAAAPTAAQDPALTRFFAATTVEERERAGARLAGSGGTFTRLHAALATGRLYSADVETGKLEWSRKSDRLTQHAVVLVPDDYDPSKAYRVCFYLHGGVSRQEKPEKGGTWWRRFDRFDGVEQISVFPAAWRGSLWWHESQIENLEAILDRIKSTYHVDENRVYMFGVSDGGTGVYYYAMKAPTPWAGFLPFIAQPAVLANPATGMEGEMFENNLVNRPFYIVNGESDRLYPAARMRPYAEAFKQLGADVTFRSRAGGHNTRWWNSETDRIDAFIESHPRDPLPERLIWETEDPESFGRIHWLIVDELTGGPPARGLFPHERSFGRVVVERTGNTFEVEATGVRRYRLLLSPREIDFHSPVRVVTNGDVSFDDEVETSVETLMHFAARDNDPSALFGAQVSIEVER